MAGEEKRMTRNGIIFITSGIACGLLFGTLKTPFSVLIIFGIIMIADAKIFHITLPRKEK